MGKLRNYLIVLIAIVSVVVGVTDASAEPRPYGDVRVLASVPSPPGFPEGIAVRDGIVYVAGPATFGTTGKPASRVLAFDRDTGELVRTYVTVGEKILAEHANSSIAFDGAGRLYVLNTQLGLFRLDPVTGVQEPYGAPFPNLPPCLPIGPPRPCSPSLANTPSIPNDLAFDAAGNAYVTDSLQSIIWRVPAGGGAPQIWMADRRFASPYIGINGIRINPAGTHAYVTVTTDLLGRGRLYRIPLVASPAASQLELVHQFATGDMPDGIAFGATGLIYVAMATPTKSGIAILSASGSPVRRLGNAALSPVAPYDSPANLAFDGAGAVLLTNHAFATGLVLKSAFNVLDVFVDDAGAPLFTP